MNLYKRDMRRWIQKPAIFGQSRRFRRTRVENREFALHRHQSWMRYWTAVDNWPENEPDKPRVKKRLGKRRKLPDIKLKYAGQRETLYFRLRQRNLPVLVTILTLSATRTAWAVFLRRVYGRQDRAGGLLGYVQTESSEIHAGRIQTAFSADPKKYGIRGNEGWALISWRNGPKCSFRVVHSRTDRSDIVIFYTFLPFR